MTISQQKMLEYLDSEEGQKAFSDYFDEIEKRNNRKSRHIQKITSLDNIDEILLKIIRKYQDMEKNNHLRYYHSRKRLLYLICNYIETGNEIDVGDESVFPIYCFILNNWKLTILHGQGTCCSIYYNGEYLIDF